MEATDLLRRLERNLTEVAAFYEIGKALTSTLELGRVLELIMVKVGDLPGALQLVAPPAG